MPGNRVATQLSAALLMTTGADILQRIAARTLATSALLRANLAMLVLISMALTLFRTETARSCAEFKRTA